MKNATKVQTLLTSVRQSNTVQQHSGVDIQIKNCPTMPVMLTITNVNVVIIHDLKSWSFSSKNEKSFIHLTSTTSAPREWIEEKVDDRTPTMLINHTYIAKPLPQQTVAKQKRKKGIERSKSTQTIWQLNVHQVVNHILLYLNLMVHTYLLHSAGSTCLQHHNDNTQHKKQAKFE